MYHIKKLTALLMCAVITGAAYAAEITDVMVRQRWPWSRKVDIEYILRCEDGGEYDVEIKAYNGNVPLSLPMESLSGDITSVQSGTRRILWDPTLTEYADDGSLVSFKVELSITPVPLYMIIDLTKSAGDTDQIEYVYENDLTNGIGGWGDWERNPVSKDDTVIESVIWTDVTNRSIYKTEKVVLRRVRAGSFVMGTGSKAQNVTLTKDFYIGVFPITQQQWAYVNTNAWPSYFNEEAYRSMRAVEMVSYNNIRGNNFGTNWPGIDGKGDHRVDKGSFMQIIRDMAGCFVFDLPTEAQWEYACRADTTGSYNVPGASMDVLGRYRDNGGYLDGEAPENDCTADNGTANVGSYLPNAWGIYDMHGNVYEWCLDYSDDFPGGIDPVGVGGADTTSLSRIRRGGCWQLEAKNCTSTGRWGTNPSYRINNIGFRLVRHLP